MPRFDQMRMVCFTRIEGQMLHLCRVVLSCGESVSIPIVNVHRINHIPPQDESKLHSSTKNIRVHLVGMRWWRTVTSLEWDWRIGQVVRRPRKLILKYQNDTKWLVFHQIKSYRKTPKPDDIPIGPIYFPTWYFILLTLRKCYDYNYQNPLLWQLKEGPVAPGQFLERVAPLPPGRSFPGRPCLQHFVHVMN